MVYQNLTTQLHFLRFLLLERMYKSISPNLKMVGYALLPLSFNHKSSPDRRNLQLITNKLNKDITCLKKKVYCLGKKEM